MGRERVSHPSILRMVIWPEASRAQSSMGTVSEQGRTVCVLMRRRNSSFRRSMALVVRADFHCSGGRRVKANSRSPASSRLSETARHLRRHLRRKPCGGSQPLPRFRHRSCRGSPRSARRAGVWARGRGGCGACARWGWIGSSAPHSPTSAASSSASSSARLRAAHASQSTFTLRQARLTTSLACRALEQAERRALHPPRVGPGEEDRGDQRLGPLRQPLIARQRL